MDQHDASQTGSRPDHAARRGGFSLAEILVVIGVIALLVGLLLPVGLKALAAGERARITADLQSISLALDAYADDFGDLPRPADGEVGTGFAVLTKALIGPGPELVTDPATGDYIGAASSDLPTLYNATIDYDAGDLVSDDSRIWVAVRERPDDVQPSADNGTNWAAFSWDDGAEGPGTRNVFTLDPNGRVVASGPVTPPYLNPERFNVDGLAIRDVIGGPVLYFPGNPRPGPQALADNYATVQSFAAGSATYPQFDLADNLTFFLEPSETLPDNADAARQRMQATLGDYDTDGGVNPKADVAEPAPRSTGYILWASGPDLQFGVSTALNGSLGDEHAGFNRAQVQGGTATNPENDTAGPVSFTPNDDVINVRQ